ncbi:MAG: hypothetical protein AAF348_07580 [Bacteroidota bacterium]
MKRAKDFLINEIDSSIKGKGHFITIGQYLHGVTFKEMGEIVERYSDQENSELRKDNEELRELLKENVDVIESLLIYVKNQAKSWTWRFSFDRLRNSCTKSKMFLKPTTT